MKKAAKGLRGPGLKLENNALCIDPLKELEPASAYYVL